MCLNNSQNVGNLLYFVFSDVGMKITESFGFFQSCCCVNLSRRLRIVTGKVYPTRTLYGTICGIRRHLEETIGSKLAV